MDATIPCVRCGKEVAKASTLLSDAGPICNVCQLDADTEAHTSGLHAAAIAGLVVALVPFVIVYETTSSVNGEVTYRNWVAVTCGIGAILVALFVGVGVARKQITGPMNMGAAALVLLLGGFQLLSGFGVFKDLPEASKSTVEFTEDTSDPVGNAPDDGPSADDPKTIPVSDNSGAAGPDPAAPKTPGCDAHKPADCEAPCAGGDKLACAILGDALTEGTRIPEDLSRGVDLLADGCLALEMPSACTEAANNALRLPEDDPRRADATKYAKRGCDLGGAGACNDYAAYLIRDEKRPIPEAAPLFAKACDLGSDMACDNLAAHMKNGTIPWDAEAIAKGVLGICTDNVTEYCENAAMKIYEAGKLETAVKVFDSWCEQGGMSECSNAGWLYYELGDRPKALTLLERACAADHPNGCKNLGNVLRNSEPKDLAASFVAIDKMCSLGDGRGCTDAALSLRDGKGMEADMTAAMARLERGCTELNFARACELRAEWEAALAAEPAAGE